MGGSSSSSHYYEPPEQDKEGTSLIQLRIDHISNAHDVVGEQIKGGYGRSTPVVLIPQSSHSHLCCCCSGPWVSIPSGFSAIVTKFGGFVDGDEDGPDGQKTWSPGCHYFGLYYSVDHLVSQLIFTENMSDTELLAKFQEYAKFGSDKATDGTTMGNKNFVKLLKDAGVMSMKGKNKVTSTDADLCFAKIKAKGEKRITFEQFKDGLGILAPKKFPGIDPSEAYTQVAGLVCGGSMGLTGTTKVAAVALHDDPNNYTGVYAQGGPSTVDKTAVTLNALADRSPADARGVKS